MNWIIAWSLRNRFVVIVGSVCLAALGAYSLTRLNIDAFPDTTPVQVQINAVAPALSPEEIENQLTFPVEQAISGLKGLLELRSVSKFGLSQVVATFEDGTDIYFARQLILERLNSLELPEGLPRPEMGPVATGLGEVLHFIISGEPDRLMDLHTVHDWVVKPFLLPVSGVAEINAWGGYEKEYQILLDPARLLRHGLTFGEVLEAVRGTQRNAGGGNLVQSGDMVLVQGLGRVKSLDEIRAIVIRAERGVPIQVKDVAEVAIGHVTRRGAVTAGGKGETVLGLGFMLMGENSNEVTRRLKQRLDGVRPLLPPGVKVETVYDRTELVDHVIETVRRNLFEGGLLVVAVLFLFLGSLRAGLIVALAIPLSMLFAFSGMLRFGIAASLLSLGAIDFGLIVDSSLILVENAVRHIARGGAGPTGSGPTGSAITGQARLDAIREAAVEVRKPTLFGELILILVYLPILTLEGIEGKMFRPMALTVVFALVGSLIVSFTLMPVLASFFLPRKVEEREPALVRLSRWAYRPVLRAALRRRYLIVSFALLVLAAAAMFARGLGSEFLPTLSEGALAINIVRLPGTDLAESVRLNTLMERAVLEVFPDEVERVWSRIGSADVATDPMGVELSDLFVTFRPRESWKKAQTQDELAALIEKNLLEIPGQRLSFSQPIEMRMEEMVSGVRADVAVKLFGDDLKVLESTAAEIATVLRAVPGCTDMNPEPITGQPVLQIRPLPGEIARYGIRIGDMMDLIEAIGGKPIGEMIEGAMRFPLAARLPERYRSDPESVGRIPVTAPGGEVIRLSRIAAIELVDGPSTITREWGQRRIAITCNVRGRDLGSFIDKARERVAAAMKMPPRRYHME